MKNWLLLNQTELNPPTHEQASGDVRIALFLSPYDVPEAVRGDFDQSIERFVIEFKYLTDEPVKLEAQGDGIAVRVGKNSGRLYAIEIDPKAVTSSTISLQVRMPKLVSSAIERFIRNSQHHAAQASYEIVRGVIDSKREDLFEGLAPVAG